MVCMVAPFTLLFSFFFSSHVSTHPVFVKDLYLKAPIKDCEPSGITRLLLLLLLCYNVISSLGIKYD